VSRSLTKHHTTNSCIWGMFLQREPPSFARSRVLGPKGKLTTHTLGTHGACRAIDSGDGTRKRNPKTFPSPAFTGGMAAGEARGSEVIAS
jgi:hypothetical protein